LGVTEMKIFVTGLVAFVAVSALGQGGAESWQGMQMPTAAEVQRVWNNPPAEYGPEPYYGLNGPVDVAVIRRDLDTMKRLGYGAVTVQYGYGASFAYLSPPWFAFFRVFLNEAKSRGLKVWIVDDAGYPSGFAGGKFSELKPELRMQALNVTDRIPANGGETITRTLKPEMVAVTAVNSEDGKNVTVPVSNGGIAWTAPAGKWTVMVVEHVFSTSPTRSDTNPKRVKDGSQSLEDYLDPAATQQYLAFTHEQYKKYVGDEFGKTILGFRGDEPDYSIRGLPWTPKFFDEFQRVKGYDVRPYLAGFFAAKPADMTEVERRAKADYYDVFAQMFRDGFFKVQGDWCAENHLEYQVHLNHEEVEMQLTRSEGEFFRAMRYVQVPGIDSIWHQIWTDTISDFPRLASSVSHVYGRPRAFTESFAAYRPEPDVTMARYILDEQFVRGVNLIETMYFPASSTPGRGGPAKFMQDPAYPALMQYVRRMSYLLSMGRPAATVALYLPSSAMWMGDEAADTAFVSTERMLSERQIDFDIVSEDALGADLKAGNGFFETASGSRYSTVILPGEVVLSEASLGRLKAFAAGGGKVLFLGHLPTMISGRTYLDARAATVADFASAKVEVSAQLAATPTPPAEAPKSAPEAQVVPGAIADAVGAVIGLADVTPDVKTTALRVMKRRLKDSDVYVFFNESATAIAPVVTFQNDAQLVEEWDTGTGKVASAMSMRDEPAKTVAVKLALKPYEVRVLMLR
jgi:alpha-L-rhamnosidase